VLARRGSCCSPSYIAKSCLHDDRTSPTAWRYACASASAGASRSAATLAAPSVRAITKGVGDERDNPTVPKRWLGGGYSHQAARRDAVSRAESSSGLVENRGAALGRGP